MCGIIGVITNEKKDMAPILIGALSRLEYRGYDSAGIALPSPNNLHVFKCVGAPSEHLSLNDCKEKSQPIITSLGIGHNRWATHGKPTLANAHPHIDSENRIAVVHNGTILNYEILRKELQDKGVVFASETDTEVIPQLIADYLKSGISMEEAFFSTVAKLTGAYGIVAFDKQDETRLYVAKEGSPIVIGMTDDAYYVASSIHGFLPFTDKFITLEDGEVAILTLKPKLAITIVNSKARKNVLTHTTQVAEQVHAADLLKGDFETFMLKEIHEQPATTLAT
jgi:glucosamine--fructose-6-phosphate aminotransferase (isomerizing)